MTEQLVEVGEIEMNYATLGDPSLPAWLSAYAKPGQVVAGRGGSRGRMIVEEHACRRGSKRAVLTPAVEAPVPSG